MIEEQNMKRCILCYLWPVQLVDSTPYCTRHWLRAIHWLLDRGAKAVVGTPTKRTAFLARFTKDEL
jgi:hypothetical protein